MLDTRGIIGVLRLITGASYLTTLTPCYTIRRPALSARDESQQPSRHDRAGFVLSSEVEMKRCKICGEMKPLEAFDKNKIIKDGHDNRCKVCRKAARDAVDKEQIKARNRAYYEANAERLREYAKEYRRNNPDVIMDYRERNRDRIQSYGQQYRETHEDERKAYTRSRYQKVRSQRLAYGREYRAKNREEVNRRARESYRKLDKETIRERNKLYRTRHADRYRKLWRNYYQRHPDQKRLGGHRQRARQAQAGGFFTVEEWRALCEKYGNRCLCCGATDKPLSADHVIPLSKGGINDISNIQPLCRSCNFKKGTKTTDYRPKDES